MAIRKDKQLSASVVIATMDRPRDLRECLDSLGRQTLLPMEVIVVDASRDKSTEGMIGEFGKREGYDVVYLRARLESSAIQRNDGASRARGGLIFFVDDDAVLEEKFLEEIIRVFEEDSTGRVGGVNGIVVNDSYAQPSFLNSCLLRIFAGEAGRGYAGRLTGPAVNFMPEDIPDTVQEVEWLHTGGVAYWKDVFFAHRFSESFLGYSFMEDVHLSARVSKEYRLLNTTRARLHHKSKGILSHRDWVALGESHVLNRHAIMAYVLGREKWQDYLRLFGYELIYCTAAILVNGKESRRNFFQFLQGKLKGVWKIMAGKSPHRRFQDHA